MGQDSVLKFVYRGPSVPLISYLKNVHLKDHSVKSIRRAIDQKAAKINQRQVIKANEILDDKCFVAFDLNRLKTHESIEILFEDESILLINKPSFLTSSQEEIEKRLKKPCKLCHRLDKETSGILVLAKTKHALESLEKQFFEHSIKKRYLALVKSEKILPEKFLVNKRIAVQRKTDHQVVMHVHQNGMEAETFFKIAKVNHPYYLLECFPKTGRTHQIRVHLKDKGAPIVGDLVYGRNGSDSGRFLLHAESISFTHPESSKEMVISAKLPEDFKREIENKFRL